MSSPKVLTSLTIIDFTNNVISQVKHDTQDMKINHSSVKSCTRNIIKLYEIKDQSGNQAASHSSLK